MTKQLKKASTLIFIILLVVILIGKMSNWFFNFNEETNQLSNLGMFLLIGIGYLAGSFAYSKKVIKAIFFTCGLYLIIMNFIPDFGVFKLIIGIISMILPMIIARFLSDDLEDETA